ncbi:alpha/beta fold hydrolase [Haliangium sp.]|uniref:alpha/beta fold hydrolase n=1 Tax=Haliangium sp. TaxID=2663208 RepID=UPI003D13A7AF
MTDRAVERPDPRASNGRRHRDGAVAAVLACALGACGGTTPPAASASGETAPAAATTTPAVAEGSVPGADGDPLVYRKVGSGPSSVVIINGGPGLDMDWYVADLAPLTRTHTLIFYDQRGSGRSGLPEDPATITLDAHARDLEALRQGLGLDRVILWAHSFGPAIAARYAIAHPERVARMIFVGPIPPRAGSFGEVYSANLAARAGEAKHAHMNELSATWADAPDPVAVCREYWRLAMPPRVADPASVTRMKIDPCAPSAEAMRYSLRHTQPNTWASMGDWDWRAELAGVPAPTLIIHGHDELIPMEMVEEWVTSLPDARILRVPACGHFPYVEQPDIAFPAMNEFLSGSWPAGAEGVGPRP